MVTSPLAEPAPVVTTLLTRPLLLATAWMPYLNPVTVVSWPSLTVMLPLLLLKATMPDAPPWREDVAVTSALLSTTTVPQVVGAEPLPYPAQIPLAAMLFVVDCGL